MQITTQAEHDIAADRAQELSGAIEDSPEAREIEELADAPEDWKHKAKLRQAH